MRPDLHYIYRRKNTNDRSDWILEDTEIIDLYWERSERAISETDKKYRDRCLYVARSVLYDISDAEECLNDTYLTVWNRIPDERPKYFSSFVYGNSYTVDVYLLDGFYGDTIRIFYFYNKECYVTYNKDKNN